MSFKKQSDEICGDSRSLPQELFEESVAYEIPLEPIDGSDSEASSDGEPDYYISD